jgi:hypothetical protein
MSPGVLLYPDVQHSITPFSYNALGGFGLGLRYTQLKAKLEAPISHCAPGKRPPRTHQTPRAKVSAETWSSEKLAPPIPRVYPTLRCPAASVSVPGVTVQKLVEPVGRLSNGCPKGRNGTLVADGSKRLASSFTIGSRQPKRFPVLRVTHLLTELLQLKPAVAGDRSHTSPVSRSRAASLFQSASAMNRGQLLVVAQTSF